jgi:hypothetical protein
MTSSVTRFHIGEGTVGFEIVGDLFNLAFEDFKVKSGWIQVYNSLGLEFLPL